MKTTKIILPLLGSLLLGSTLFTSAQAADVMISNWCRTCSILVEPVDETLSLFKRLQYFCERSLVRYLMNTQKKTA